ncbi:MAG: NUDIX domain-containing protein [Clostridiales bacterium]|nr:NUDIX domain-containing protein [Clostridiales bacterium]
MKLTVNAIIVFDPSGKNLLMCKRIKEPFLGQINFVGGKVKPNGEDHFSAAYRELEEETAITSKDISLTHVMTFDYPLEDLSFEIYVGQLARPVTVDSRENPLLWVSIYDDFFDTRRFAGGGNIGHMLEKVKEYGLISPNPS